MSEERAPSRDVVARQVAEALGVSIATVSRAFTPQASIAEATRDRVLAKAAELGYQPNLHARSLKTSESRIVAIVASDLANPFYPAVLSQLSEALENQGLSVMLICRHETGSLDAAFQSAFHYRPDVIVALAAAMSSSAIESADRAGVPVVLFNRYVPGQASGAVSCDNTAGGQAVATYLADHGLRRPLYIAGDPDSTTNRDRQAGFTQAWHARGVEVPVIAAGRYSHEAGRAAGHVLIARYLAAIDCVFCANDVVALGVIDAAREHGLGVPDAFSVIGFDDIAMAGWSSYRLTTYRQPVEAMISATVDLVRQIARGDGRPDTPIRIAGEIITRDTVKKPTPRPRTAAHDKT